MENLIDSLTFLFSTIGACLLVLTSAYITGKIIKYYDSVSLNNNKKLIKQVINETKEKKDSK